LTFKELNLIEPVLKALQEQGYTEPTPIQEQAIPQVLAGKDILASAQTGTGKTAAFALPLIQIMHTQKSAGVQGAAAHKPLRQPRTLILTPTRELAIQIYENIRDYSKYTHLKSCVVFGGVNQHKQVMELHAGTDFLIATPGRLLDLMNQRLADLSHINCLILDEADRMLDMGFIHDVKRIIGKIPVVRQTLLFSATMPHEIGALATSILRSPVRIEVSPVSSTVDKIGQRMYYVAQNDKRDLLVHLLQTENIKSALVFTRTKHGADRVTRDLEKTGIQSEAIHGNKSQAARQRALAGFKSGTIRVLVATDIAARGIDVELLSHVINYEIPNIPETYVHRIGRTGRAGASGIAFSFCSPEELDFVRDIQKLTGFEIEPGNGHPFPSFDPRITKGVPLKQGGESRGGSGNQGSRSGGQSGRSGAAHGARKTGAQRHGKRSGQGHVS